MASETKMKSVSGKNSPTASAPSAKASSASWAGCSAPAPALHPHPGLHPQSRRRGHAHRHPRLDARPGQRPRRNHEGKSADELKALTPWFRERLANGETLEDILPEPSPPAARPVWRTKNMRHFDSQILGGIVLHRGNIAEMSPAKAKPWWPRCGVPQRH